MNPTIRAQSSSLCAAVTVFCFCAGPGGLCSFHLHPTCPGWQPIGDFGLHQTESDGEDANSHAIVSGSQEERQLEELSREVYLTGESPSFMADTSSSTSSADVISPGGGAEEVYSGASVFNWKSFLVRHVFWPLLRHVVEELMEACFYDPSHPTFVCLVVLGVCLLLANWLRIPFRG